jgi:uncharacterized protein (TIGR02271 family)
LLKESLVADAGCSVPRVPCARKRLTLTFDGPLAAMTSAVDLVPPEGAAPTTVPVVAESLDVTRERQVTGLVRVAKDVHERQVLVDEPLIVETVSVERRPVDPAQRVDAAPGVRHEGDVTIVPVVEERLVLTKVLVVTEEIHIRRVRTERHAPQTVTLRSERVRVERDASPQDTTNAERGGDSDPGPSIKGP